MFKLKYVARKTFPDYFRIPTYKENVEVKNGIAIVRFKQTRDRLLKEGFIEILPEIEEIEAEKAKAKTKRKSKTTK